MATVLQQKSSQSWTCQDESKPPSERNSNRDMPHSKVVHCRAIAEGCKETDLVQVMKLFGNVKALKLMPKNCQGLVEFEEIESAIACVTYSHLQPILVNGRQMYVNYSKSSEINREFTNNNLNQGQTPPTPSNILLFTIINVIHPVTVDTIKRICEQQNLEVQRIVIFHKNGLQALVEFKSIEDATQIQKAFNNCDIYPGCCTLKLEYSKTNKLNVHANTSESYDIALERQKDFHQKSRGFENGKLSSEVEAVLAAAEGFPAVQSILARVMMGGTVNGKQENIQKPGVKSLLGDNNYRSELSSAYPASRPLLQQFLQHQDRLGNGNNQNKPFDQYTSPFAALRDETSVGSGGEGCVAMVYGVNNEVINCGHLYNLFCLYGNVVKVKILVNKPGCAMVQYFERLSTEMAIENLSNMTLFGQQFQVSFSKHPFISESRQTSTLFDGSPSAVSYSDSRNNRFKFVAGGNNNLLSRIHPPSKVLHYFNAPPDITEERLEEVFESLKYDAEVPVKQAAILKPNSKSASGLLEFSSVFAAVEALILVNHITLHKGSDEKEESPPTEKAGAPFTFKLAFSPSESINS